MKLFIISLVVLLIVASIAYWKTSRFAYETAEYTVIEKDGPFEIRKYPSLVLASTRMGQNNSAQDGSFMRLFNYISKGNEASEKIAMTTPVFMKQGEGSEMSFVVPEKVVEDGVPAPTSDLVEIQTMPPGSVAAYRYSGSWKKDNRTKAEKKLMDWAADKNLRVKEEIYSAGYDPPFTPGFLRRNEVLIRIDQ